MSEVKDFKELIDSFVAYRNVLGPLQESLHALAETYEAIRTDLDSLKNTFSGGVSNKLENIHSTLNSQAKSGQELSRKIDEFAISGEKYAQAVNGMTEKFSKVEQRLEAVNNVEQSAESMLGRLEKILEEKQTSYNLNQLQKSLDAYNKNVEKISEFINKDIAEVLQQNAEKIEAIRKENQQLSAVVAQQGAAVSELTATFAETSLLLRKVVENGSVNQEYLFDALDQWAASRKVKIKR